MEKGRWKTGERRRIKGRYQNFVWEKRGREKDTGKGAEDAEAVEVETMDTAGGIEAGTFWDPDPDPPTPSLQTYLRALPSGHYLGSVFWGSAGSQWDVGAIVGAAGIDSGIRVFSM